MHKDITTAMASNRWFQRTQHFLQRHLLPVLALVFGLLSTVTVTAQAQLPTQQPGQPLSVGDQPNTATRSDTDSSSTTPGAPAAVMANMNNPRNPLVWINTNVGDIWVELFPQAAPNNVEHLIALLNDEQWRQRLYENSTFHRVERNLFIQTGQLSEADERFETPPRVGDEINALGLGLEQLPALEANGQPHAWLNIRNADDFRKRLLRPLYEQLGISDSEALAAQQGQVLGRLSDMNLLEAHQLMGYEYNARLPSRRPLAGSVVMVNRGPNTNQSEFAILLADMPWLTGTHTVIGQMVGGNTPATLISQRRPGDIQVISIQLTTAGSTGRTGSGISQSTGGLQ